MTTLEEIQVLPADMRASACGVIFDVLKANRGQSIIFDGSAVTKMDAVAAQLFVMAAKSWGHDGQDFQIAPASETIFNTMDCLGLSNLVQMKGSTDDN